MLTQPAPFLVAVVASLLVAVLAWRLRALSGSGAAAATLIGSCALSVSIGVGGYLVAWFVLASVLSRVGKRRKAERVSGIVEKGGRRDAGQVLANGGVFALLLLSILGFDVAFSATSGFGSLLAVGAAGSLAAAGADTWATEIGALLGGDPFSVRTGSRVPAGTSGAVTGWGCLGMLLGAAVLALLAGALAVIPLEARPMLAVAAGGVLGACADTVLGAWLQERRNCPRCDVLTEQRAHVCGTATTHHSGMRGLGNDAVNAACALAGAIGAMVTVLL